ncbi:MAG: HYR domain-containing protein [Flavobacteriales bacterium]|nr:HYR domain-containing protein [Flavobacteriales bacterium]
MTITVIDDENPVVVCPADQNEYFTSSCEFTIPDYTVLAMTNDNCDTDVTLTQIPVAGTVVTGNTMVTITATDDALNFSNCTFEVILLDSIVPVISNCPSNQSVAYTNDCDYTLHDYINEFSVNASDNCDNNVVLSQSPVAGTIILGNTTITITATDDSGNFSTCVFDVTPSDQTSPNIFGCPGNFDVSYDNACGFTIPDYATILGITVTDNCDPNPVLIQSPNSGTLITTPTTINLTAIDNQGNMSLCAFTINPVDTSVPTIVSCVPDTIVDAESDCGFTMPDFSPLMVTNDNCDGGLTIDQSPIPGWVIYSNTTVTMTVTDDAGNFTECQFDITIMDTTDPVITICAPDTVEQVNGTCDFTIPSYTSLVTATDNCDASLTLTQSPAAGTVVSGHGTVIPVTITATDDASNFTSCTFNITLNDPINPTIICPANLTVNTDGGLCTAAVNIPAPTVADNCSVVSVVNDYNNTADASDVYPQGTTTINWTVTDIAGNIATCAMNVVVNDNEDPAITCPMDITQTADSGVCEAAVAILAPITSDNCGVATVINNYNNSADATDIYPVGTTNVVWTVTDIHGNTSSCTQVVIITDDEVPSIVCPADITQTADAGVCEAQVNVDTPTVSDNCAVASVVNDYNGTSDASDIYPVGITPVTFTVTDIHGNTSVCTMNIVVTDNEAPVVTCPTNINQTADPAVCQANVIVPAPAVADNCAIASIINDYNNTSDASDIYPVGTTTVTFTVTDIHGNSSVCSMDITITDDEQPVITCPLDITADNDSSLCEAFITVPAITAADNCAVASMVNDYNNTADASDIYPVGTTTITWTVTDIHGNVSTCAQTIVVNDPELPIITCPTDITQTADAGVCEAFVSVSAPAVADNCSVASVVNDYNNTSDATDVYPVGTTTITWTVTDIHGNTANCSMLITVTDNEQPVITCPADINQTADAGVCEALVNVPALANSDNCGIASIVNDYNNTDNASGTYPVGTTVVNWTVTDIHGNVSTCAMNITITDDEQPVITCPADIVVANDTILCDVNITVPSITVQDNCAIASIINDHNGTADASGTYLVGTTSVIWTVTDIHGNVSTCTQTITVNDDEAPAIACPSDTTHTADAGLCSAALSIPLPVVSDNCTIATIVNDYNNSADATDIYPVGTTNVVWTVTDIHGNTSSCTQVVIITDDEVPSIVCPADITQTADAGVCEAQVNVDTPTVSDNCAVASVVNDYNGTSDASDIYPVGITPVTFTVTDIHGNTSVCTMNIVVTDNEAPVVTCPTNINQTADPAVCQANVIVPAPAVADNCAIASIINDYNNTSDASDIYPVGTTTVTFTVTDIHGNSSVCSMDITITDDEQPVITCPLDITADNDSSLCEAFITVPAITAADNCAVASMVNDYNNTADASDIYPVGTTTITWTVTDIHGNVSTCAQTIVVNDPELPIITCPTDITQTADAGVCEAFVSVSAPAVADNCSVASVVNDYNNTSDATDVYPVGTTTITWTVTDIHGNTANCSMLITVTDNEQPVITCPADINQTADAGVCEALVNVPALANSDNCGIASIVNDYNNTDNASGTYPVGTTVVNWTVTDIHGNVSTCAMNITITDDEQPVITCPADIVVANDTLACDAQIIVPQIVAADNCSISSISNSFNNSTDASGLYPVGTTEVIWTVSDIHGNVSTCTQVITVEDTEDPTINCPTDITVTNDPGSCGAQITVAVPTVADNCGLQSIVNNYNNSGNASDEYPVGTTEVIWTVTDIHGNTSTCTMNITVTDTEIPTITCAENITVDNEPGICDAYVTVTSPTVSDNCSIVSVVNNFNGTNDASGMYPSGTTAVIWTVTDVNGNTNTCVQVIQVNDTEQPIANNCGYTIEQNNDPQQCGAVVTYDIPVVTDNCSIADTTLIAGLASGEFFPVGTTEVIYQFTDAAGNSVECNFFVTIIDAELPTVVCTDDVEVNTDPGQCGAVVTYTIPSFQDNCGTATGQATMIAGLEPGELFPVGTTEVTYDIIDGAGNVSTCTFHVTVTDLEAPVIECAADIVTTDPIVNYDLPIVSDNCSATLQLLAGLEPGDVFPHGYTDVTYVAIDPSGNADTCTFTVLVNNPPTAVTDGASYDEDDSSITVDMIGNDYDIDGDSISITSIYGGHGIVTLNPDGSLTYNINTEEWCGLDTVYYVLCDSYNACDTGYVLIDVECYLFIIIPEGFSPNGDGVNDLFEIIGIEDYTNNKLSIFNRWGHKVFEANKYDNTWNGTSESPVTIGNGMLPKGTYFYVLDLGDGSKLMRGSIFLNR